MREDNKRSDDLSEGEFIKGLELFTPVEFLMRMNQGNPIREPEIKLVKELQDKGLSDGVINVLFFFIVQKGQGLGHDVVWAIADDWINKNVAITSEAYSMAQKLTPLNDHLRH